MLLLLSILLDYKKRVKHILGGSRSLLILLNITSIKNSKDLINFKYFVLAYMNNGY